MKEKLLFGAITVVNVFVIVYWALRFSVASPPDPLHFSARIPKPQELSFRNQGNAEELVYDREFTGEITQTMPDREMITENEWFNEDFWIAFTKWPQDQQLKLLKIKNLDSEPAELALGLYLGSVGAAISKSVLQRLGITHILGVAASIVPMFPDDFTYKSISIQDDQNASMLAVLPSALDFVDEGINSGGKVLVHWFYGQSRSSTVVLAWLMRQNLWTLDTAMNYVNLKRKIRPNDNFKNQLRKYEMELGPNLN